MCMLGCVFYLTLYAVNRPLSNKITFMLGPLASRLLFLILSLFPFELGGSFSGTYRIHSFHSPSHDIHYFRAVAFDSFFFSFRYCYIEWLVCFVCNPATRDFSLMRFVSYRCFSFDTDFWFYSFFLLVWKLKPKDEKILFASLCEFHFCLNFWNTFLSSVRCRFVRLSIWGNDVGDIFS